MRLPVKHVHERAAQRPDGYVETVIASGKVEGDVLVLTAEAYERLLAEYAMKLGEASLSRCPGCGE